MQQSRPEHVPEALVRECPIADRRVYDQNVYDTLLAGEHRDKPPVYWSPNVYFDGSGAWVVRTAHGLRQILADEALFCSKGLSGFAQTIGEDWDLVPLELVGEEHRAVRKLLNPELSAPKMSALGDIVRHRASDLIDRFQDRGRCEFISEFAVPFPVTIFFDLFGLPQSLYDQFIGWGQQLQNPDIAVRAAGTRKIKDYLMDVIAKRRAAPRDDLISHAIDYRLDGKPWSDDMIFGYYFNMFVGGLDTVATNLGLQFHHLARHPEQQAELRGDPAKCPLAIEELLRAYSPITVYRTLTRDTTFQGVQMRSGDRITVSLAIAGRDPDEWEALNKVKLERRPNHLGFGVGPHRCVGMHLARRELQIAMEELLARLPEFRVVEAAPVPFWIGNIIAVRHLPLAWN